MNDHPKYKNPTIVEVDCEIAFTRAGDNRLSSKALYAIFGEEFPEIQPVANLNVQVVLSQAPPVPQRPAPTTQNVAYRFSTADNASYVQVSDTTFIYQTTEQYPGWDIVKAKLIGLWDKASAALAVQTIAKIGLRYINRIPLTEEKPNVLDWVQPTRDIPESLLSSQEHMLGRLESTPSKQHLKLVTVAIEPNAAGGLGAVVIDIDRITLEQSPLTPALISEKLEHLHQDVWDVFAPLRTPALERHLSGTSE